MGFLRSPGEVYMVWLWGFVVTLKTPRAPRYFSERYGHWKPKIAVFGFRLFVDKAKLVQVALGEMEG
jgi:hypothetical protein